MTPFEDGLIDVCIVGRHEEANGIVSLDLAPVSGDLPPFEAGAHVDVLAADGITRQYSICSPPAERHRYRLGILLENESRGGSTAIHRDFVPGRVVRISKPRNNFPLHPARRSLLLAGGIGVTPMIAMAHHLHATGAAFDLHYCSRTRARTAFVEELRAAPFAARVHVHYDDGPAESRFSLGEVLRRPDEGTHVYVCGPSGFMDFVIDGAKAAGWPSTRIHTEYFSANVLKEGAAFTLVAARSGKRLTVPEDKTMAEVLLASGVDVSVSCEQGICGACLTAVLEGSPDHRDMFQSDAEKAANTHVTLCCSRARTPVLVVDA